VSVYPNPVSDILKISFKSNNQNKAVITLFNTIGNQVVTDQTEVNEGNNLFSIDIRKNAIAPGVYFVRLAVENEVFLRKLVVK
jgi:methionine-rich copper-binding protein CopC